MRTLETAPPRPRIPVAAPASNLDGALVMRLRAGEERAFIELVDRYDAQLRRLARVFVVTEQATADVVQATWLSVLKGLDRFDNSSALKTWIFRILLGQARARTGSDARPFALADVGAPEREERPAVDPACFCDGSWINLPQPLDIDANARLLPPELHRRLPEIIDGLPEEQRIVILLRDVAGLSTAEVAEDLGISVADQRTILHRARSRVHTTLATYAQA